MLEIFLAYDSSDEYWRIRFNDVFGHDFNCRMVPPGEIDVEDGKEYVDWLLKGEMLTPETVMVVLIGPKAFGSKKLDWELAAALEMKDSRPTGVVPVRLPSHEDHGKQSVSPRRLPYRVADNLKSGYFKMYDWTESPQELENRLYAALKDARSKGHMAKNARELMKRDMLL